MFDSTNVNVSYCNRYSQVVNILPACIGTLQKSSPLSKIIKCNIDSEFAIKAFDKFDPHIVRTVTKSYKYTSGCYEETEKIPIVVLQVMVFGNNECLIEFITKEELNNQSCEQHE
jgi:hypothetical protein